MSEQRRKELVLSMLDGMEVGQARDFLYSVMDELEKTTVRAEQQTDALLKTVAEQLGVTM